jgi:hypothetical protein
MGAVTIVVNQGLPQNCLFRRGLVRVTAAACLFVATACGGPETDFGISIDAFPSEYNAAVSNHGSGVVIASIQNDDEYCVLIGSPQNCGVWRHPDVELSVGWNTQTLLITHVGIFGDTYRDEEAQTLIGSIVATISVISEVPLSEARDLLGALVVAADERGVRRSDPFACIETSSVKYSLSIFPSGLVFNAFVPVEKERRTSDCIDFVR